jgi:S1-C subfamily serine protease
MKDYIIILILIFLITFIFVNLRGNIAERMDNIILNESNKNNKTITNNSSNINNKTNNNVINKELDLYDDTIVRIKVHRINYNWKEPFMKNTAQESIGTGFFIDQKGHILTNHHVVHNCIKVYIQLPKYGAKTYECEVISVNPKLDIALLKSVNYQNNGFLELGDSESIKKGDEVLAIGYPLGQDKIKITGGIVSGFQDGDIQTDSAINPGNSGGPLIRENKVVGINYAGYNDAQNVGYAIPIEYVKINIPLMYQKEFINFPVLCATFNNSNETMMHVASVCQEGYYISKVLENGTFDIAGIKTGDIICQFDNLPMDNYGEVYLPKLKSKFHISDYMKYKKIGDIVPVDLVRVEGKNKKIIKTKVELLGNDYYTIRTLYPNYDKLDYQMLGGMVIMPLSNNHLHLKDFKEVKSLQMYNVLPEKIKEKLIITKVIKGSTISENEIIQAPLILKEVNGMPVSNMIDLRRLLLLFQTSNQMKYISFLTENDKYFMLELNDLRKEEEFLSKKFSYEITEYTQKLLDFGTLYNSNNNNNNNNNNLAKASPAPSEEKLNQTMYNILSKENVSPLAPMDSKTLEPIMSLVPIDASQTPAISPSMSNLQLNNIAPSSSSELLAPIDASQPSMSNLQLNNIAPSSSSELLAPIDASQPSMSNSQLNNIVSEPSMSNSQLNNIAPSSSSELLAPSFANINIPFNNEEIVEAVKIPKNNDLQPIHQDYDLLNGLEDDNNFKLEVTNLMHQ